MTKEQIKSLELVDQLFENMTLEEFLAAYEECETGVGPTVSEFLDSFAL